MTNIVSTVVRYLSRHPKVEGLTPASDAGTRGHQDPMVFWIYRIYRAYLMLSHSKQVPLTIIRLSKFIFLEKAKISIGQDL
jgi:hypothetical protein